MDQILFGDRNKLLFFLSQFILGFLSLTASPNIARESDSSFVVADKIHFLIGLLEFFELDGCLSNFLTLHFHLFF